MHYKHFHLICCCRCYNVVIYYDAINEGSIHIHNILKYIHLLIKPNPNIFSKLPLIFLLKPVFGISNILFQFKHTRHKIFKSIFLIQKLFLMRFLKIIGAQNQFPICLVHLYCVKKIFKVTNSRHSYTNCLPLISC